MSCKNTEEKMTKMTDEYARAKNSVLRLLKIRQRSEQELRTKLKLQKISEAVIDQVIQYFKKLRFIDDRQFARSWIRGRLTRPFGLDRIRFELKTKGIANDIIKEQITSAKENYNEYETVMELARRRFSRYKGIEPLKAKQRTFGYLSRRGFSIEAIQSAIRKL